MDGKKILVVDDDLAIRETIAAILEVGGYAVETATDGIDAQDHLGELPALILLDMMMPRMDGIAFAAELDRRGLRPRIPILVLTADGRARQKAAAIHAEAFLEKPFDMSALLGVVARLTA